MCHVSCVLHYNGSDCCVFACVVSVVKNNRTFTYIQLKKVEKEF